MDKGSVTKGKRSARARKKVMFRDDDDDMQTLLKLEEMEWCTCWFAPLCLVALHI